MIVRLVTLFMWGKDLQKEIVAQTERYNGLLDQLQTEKNNLVALMRENDKLVKEKERLNEEIEKIKSNISAC